MFRFVLFVVIIGGIVGFIGKVVMKRRMSRALGRDVSDHEINSLNAWMDVHDKEQS